MKARLLVPDAIGPQAGALQLFASEQGKAEESDREKEYDDNLNRPVLFLATALCRFLTWRSKATALCTFLVALSKKFMWPPKSYPRR